MQLKNKKAVIFDMDGTLIDSMWVWKAIDLEFLGQHGIELDEQQQRALQHQIEGRNFYETACLFKECFALQEDVLTIMNIWNEMAFDKYANDIVLKKGVREFLEYLSDNHIKMGIATSNSRKLTMVCLRALGIEHFFEVVATAEEVHCGKPNPDIYLYAARELYVNPSECLVFEDVPMGILAGKNAGMAVCAVDDSFSAHLIEKKRTLADYFIEDFSALLSGSYEVCHV